MLELWVIFVTANLVSAIIGAIISLLVTSTNWYQKITWRIILKMMKSNEFRNAVKEMSSTSLSLSKEIIEEELNELATIEEA